MTSYRVYRDQQLLWRWTFFAGNGKIIAVSSESYHNKSDCLSAISLVKSSKDSPIVE
jgi:uncharacterized protein YegP (UPF0339 family)